MIGIAILLNRNLWIFFELWDHLSFEIGIHKNYTSFSGALVLGLQGPHSIHPQFQILKLDYQRASSHTSKKSPRQACEQMIPLESVCFRGEITIVFAFVEIYHLRFLLCAGWFPRQMN
jgi:hypothetical protein